MHLPSVNLYSSAYLRTSGLLHVEEVRTVEILTYRDPSEMEGLWSLYLKCDLWPQVKWPMVSVLHLYGQSP